MFATSLLLAACALPAAMGLTLNTPADTPSDGNLAVSWVNATGDPVFVLIMKEQTTGESIEIGTGFKPEALAANISLSTLTPGTYTLEADVGTSIGQVVATSGAFQILEQGATPPAAAPPAEAPPAAAPPATTTAAATAPAGTQFITGTCAVDGDCASGCCSPKNLQCAARAVAEGPGGGGCGAGGAAAAPPAAAPPAGDNSASAPSAANPPPNVGGPPFDPAGVPNIGNGVGKQFIGGQCLSAADCASGCCAGPSGICSGPGAQTQAGKTGCGFVAGGASAAPPAAAAPAAAPATPPPNVGGPPFDPAGVPNVGNGAGKQFIGGQCLSEADCASGCCAGPSGICSGVGAQTQAGKTGCGFVAKRFVTRSRYLLA